MSAAPPVIARLPVVAEEFRVFQAYCANCGSVGFPKTYTKGSFGLELLLWLCFLIPGVFYSVWRLSSRYRGCPICGAPNMIPASSPRAKELLARGGR